MRSQICARLGGRERRIEPAEQQLRDLLLLAQHRAPGRFGRMRGEHRLDPDLDHEAADLVEREPLRLEPASRPRHAAGLRRAFVEILAAAADAMHLLGHVDHLEPRSKTRAPGRALPRPARRACGTPARGRPRRCRRGARSPPAGRSPRLRTSASPPCSRITSPTSAPSTCTSSRSSASLGGKEMSERGMAGVRECARV